LCKTHDGHADFLNEKLDLRPNLFNALPTGQASAILIDGEGVSYC
jgi:hypothetical protein